MFSLHQFPTLPSPECYKLIARRQFLWREDWGGKYPGWHDPVTGEMRAREVNNCNSKCECLPLNCLRVWEERQQPLTGLGFSHHRSISNGKLSVWLFCPKRGDRGAGWGPIRWLIIKRLDWSLVPREWRALYGLIQQSITFPRTF